MQFEAASRSSPKSCRRLPSRVHNAGFPTFEARVTYPFHPLVDQTVLVTGSHEHEGVHYLLILAHGGSFQIPAWMFDPAASSIEIVAAPRLSATKLVELRAKLCCLTIPLRSLRSPIAHSILRERRRSDMFVAARSAPWRSATVSGSAACGSIGPWRRRCSSDCNLRESRRPCGQWRRTRSVIATINSNSRT